MFPRLNGQRSTSRLPIIQRISVLCGIDGEPIEFEWNTFPEFTSSEILRQVQKDLKTRQTNPQQFEGRTLFMSMFNDIDWRKKGHSLHRISNSTEVRDYGKRFQQGHWSFFGPGNERNGMGRMLTSQKEDGRQSVD